MYCCRSVIGLCSVIFNGTVIYCLQLCSYGTITFILIWLIAYCELLISILCKPFVIDCPNINVLLKYSCFSYSNRYSLRIMLYNNVVYKNVLFGHLNRLARTGPIRIVWSYTTHFREAKLADTWALSELFTSL